MSRKGEVLEKRFRFAGSLWRLLVEGRIARVDLWYADGDDSDWSVRLGGVIKDGAIDWSVIHDVFMLPLPDKLDYVAYQHLLTMALARSGDEDANEGTPEMVESMVRARTAAERRGVLKVAARKIGVSIAEYQENRQRDRRWCYLRRHWVPGDDLYPSGKCRHCAAAEHRAAKARDVDTIVEMARRLSANRAA